MPDKPKIRDETETDVAARLAAASGDPLVIASVATAVARSEPKKDGITDTSKMSNPGAADLLACQMLTGRAIEHMEERGQRELVGQRSRLPTKGTQGHEETWAQIGVKIVAVDEDDPVFSFVELPAGWTLRGTDHAMWSELVDVAGSVRAQIFYKAAFYDRSAHVNIQQRFTFQTYADDCMRGEHKTRAGLAAEYRSKVVDNKIGEVTHWTDWHGDGEPQGDWTPTGSEAARDEAVAWLKEHRPDWENPTAYWE